MPKRNAAPAAHQLDGPPKETYTGSLTYRRYMTVGFLIILGLYGSSQAGENGIIVLGSRAWTALLVAEVAVLIIMIVQDLSFRVWTFRDGLVYAKIGRRIVVRWEDIAVAWFKVAKTRGGRPVMLRRYNIQLDNGSKLTFDDRLKNVEELGETIKRETTRRLLSRAIERVQSGEVVSFKEINVSEQGVSAREREIRWAKVAGVRIDEEDGMISILNRQKGKQQVWGSVHIGGTPNPYVLVGLIRHFTRAKRQ